MSDTSPIRFDPSKNGYYRADSKTKPTGSAGGKDFGRIMSKNEQEGKSSSGKKNLKTDTDDIDENGGDEVAFLEEEQVPQGPVSLFDMSKMQSPKAAKPLVKNAKGSNTSQSTKSVADGKKEAPSPANLKGAEKKQDTTENDIDPDDHVPVDQEHIGDAAGIIQADVTKKANLTKGPSRPFDLIAATSHEANALHEKPVVQKGKNPSEFNREQPDLSAVNPLAGVQPGQNLAMNLNTQTNAPVAPVRNIQELINQMVKEVQSMEAQGKTDTTITLKQPPIFEGAQLVVTSFNSARGEFNIAFENLSAAAQQIISNEHNKASLMAALEQKGYHVHMVTASTIDEQRLFTTNVEDPRRDREQNREDEEQDGRQQRNRDQEG